MGGMTHWTPTSQLVMSMDSQVTACSRTPLLRLILYFIKTFTKTPGEGTSFWFLGIHMEEVWIFYFFLLFYIEATIYWKGGFIYFIFCWKMTLIIILKRGHVLSALNLLQRYLSIQRFLCLMFWSKVLMCHADLVPKPITRLKELQLDFYIALRLPHNGL